MPTFFDERIDIRLRSEELQKIDRIMETNKHKYDSRAHFIRCAVIKLIKKEYNSSEVKII